MKTTLFAVLCIVIRLGVLLLAVQVLVALPVLLGMPNREFLAMELGFAALTLLLAAVLWVRPGWLARCAMRGGDDLPLEGDFDASGLQRVAFATLGAWFLVEGLAYVVPSVVAAWEVHASQQQYPGMQVPAGQWNNLIRALVLLVAGAALMLGSQGLTMLLQHLRGRVQTQGVSPDDDVDMTPRD